ncbi:MAG: hypothetical protein R6V47_03880 [Candidatus Delongbacteria bacterium]
MDLFKDIVGQNAVTENLSAAILNNKLHHAYLFSGPSGVGKEAVAIELVKILNCQTGKGTSPYCGRCRSCRELGSFTSDDLIYIFPSVFKSSDTEKAIREKNSQIRNALKKKAELKGYYKFDFKTGRFITLPQINEIKFFARYNSIHNSRKFVILTMAELMNKEAQNSLLKILEEPPKNMSFILISQNTSFLFDTIRSRCLNLDFPLLNQKDIKEFIKKYYPDILTNKSEQLAKDSYGSIDNLSKLISEKGSDLIDASNSMFDILNNTLPPQTVSLSDSLLDQFKMMSDADVDYVLKKTVGRLIKEPFGEDLKKSVEYKETIVNDFSNFYTLYKRNINPRLLMINLYLNYREELKKWKKQKTKR